MNFAIATIETSKRFLGGLFSPSKGNVWSMKIQYSVCVSSTLP
uniref:Uncharacterized protein n=1 Tax=Anguilla anguilla TaxID=7936 RepID=A0A0E9U7Q6_ANGAN